MIVLHAHARVHGVVEDEAERSVPSVIVAQAGSMSRMIGGHRLSARRVQAARPRKSRLVWAGPPTRCRSA
jgi:hypothetical protein